MTILCLLNLGSVFLLKLDQTFFPFLEDRSLLVLSHCCKHEVRSISSSSALSYTRPDQALDQSGEIRLWKLFKLTIDSKLALLIVAPAVDKTINGCANRVGLTT